MFYDFLQKNICAEDLAEMPEFKNDFLLKNNMSSLSKVYNFYLGDSSVLCVTGFQGVGKYEIIKISEKFLNDRVLKLDYVCSESTTVDDLLMYLFLECENYKKSGLIPKSTVKSNDFLTQINYVLSVSENPFLITISKLDLVKEDHLQELLNCLYFFLKTDKVKVIIISKIFDTDLIPSDVNYSTLVIKAMQKEVFLDYLKFSNIVSTNQKFDDIYKYTRGYFYSVTVLIFFLKMTNITISDFFADFLQSGLSFDKFLCRKIYSSLPKICSEIISLLLFFRHGINKKVFELSGICDEYSFKYLTEQKIISEINRFYYINDYFKYNTEVLFQETDAVKYHEKLADFYEKQIPLKPSERLCIISRQTMKNELEYHKSFLTNITKIKSEQEMAITNEPDDFINMYNKSLEMIKVYDYDNALNLLKELLLIDNYPDYDKFLPDIYKKIVLILSKKVSWSDALCFQNLLTDFYKKQNNKKELYESLYQTAVIYFKLYKIDNALTVLNNIVKSDIDNSDLYVNSYVLASEIYQTQNDYENAKFNYEKVLEVNDMKLSPEVKQNFYFKYALFNDEEDDYVRAKEFYEKCLNLKIESEITSSAYYNLAQLYLAEKNYEKATELISCSLQNDLKNNNTEGLFADNFELGIIYSKTEPEKALKYLQNACSYADKTGDLFLIAKSKLTLGDLIFFNRDYKESLIKYLEVYKITKDSFSKDNLEKIVRRINDARVKVSPELFLELENTYAK